MKSDRFEYFRNFVSANICENNFENYGFVIYGSIIFLVFPLLVLLENLLAVTILLAGKSRKNAREIISRFGKMLRIKVRKKSVFQGLKQIGIGD